VVAGGIELLPMLLMERTGGTNRASSVTGKPATGGWLAANGRA
jgi:hypothetical protein